MTEAKAARRAARTEPLTETLGSETFVFEPEMPFDIVLALDTLSVESMAETRIWVEAHLLVDAPCDTSCADDGLSLLARDCPAEKALRERFRKARLDDRRLRRDEFNDFHDRLLAKYAVTEGESSTSADSPATAGEHSSGTVSEPVST